MFTLNPHPLTGVDIASQPKPPSNEGGAPSMFQPHPLAGVASSQTPIHTTPNVRTHTTTHRGPYDDGPAWGFGQKARYTTTQVV